MSDFTSKKQQEIDQNYQEFLRLRPSLMEQYSGQFVVMRDKKTIAFFDTAKDAIIHATRTYPDGIFSVQEVTEDVADLGWFSHAPHYAIV